MKISYNKHALNATAQYVWDNNPSVPLWPNAPHSVEDVKAQIKADMYRLAKENADYIRLGIADTNWKTYSGTGGYMFIFSTEEDDNIIQVDIYIQPTFKYKFVNKNLHK